MHCKPLRPQSQDLEETVRTPTEWRSPDEAGMALELEGVVDVVDGEEETIAETGECIAIPKALPSPKLPSRAEVEHHNLTHIPYRSWCPICVAARRKKNAHRSGQEEVAQPLYFARTIALSVSRQTTIFSVCW